jgi:hypothetical protein
MKTRFAVTIAAILAFSVAGARAAQTTESPAPRAPKPNFSSFSFLLGTWSCTWKRSNHKVPVRSITTWTRDDSGYWLTGSTDNPPVKWFPYEVKARERITYDSAAKLWVYVNWDDAGGYNLYTTPGFRGDTAVWTDRSFLPTRQISGISAYTMKKFGDNKYTGTYSLIGAKGSAIVVDVDTCSKS